MKKLCIVGGHPKTRKNAPWGDTSFDIWVLNEAAGKEGTSVKRWDACFQMHEPAIYQNKENTTDKNHWNWLRLFHSKKIYMQKKDSLVPDSVEYPLQEAKDLLANVIQGEKNMARLEYFTSSVAFAIALGIVKKYTEIHLYGFEMSSNEEYKAQREGFTFWIGFAAGRGIKIEIHCADKLFQGKLYGYETFLEKRTMKFNIKERVKLYDLLPREGDITTMRTVRSVRKEVEFSEEENKIANIRVEDYRNPAGEFLGKVVLWDDDKDFEKEIEITETARKILAESFAALSQKGKFTEELLDLQEKLEW